MKRGAWSWFCCKLRQVWQKALLLVIDLTDLVDSFYAFRISKNTTMINKFSPVLTRI
jgi:hypothetical protein